MFNEYSFCEEYMNNDLDEEIIIRRYNLNNRQFIKKTNKIDGYEIELDYNNTYDEDDDGNYVIKTTLSYNNEKHIYYLAGDANFSETYIYNIEKTKSFCKNDFIVLTLRTYIDKFEASKYNSAFNSDPSNSYTLIFLNPNHDNIFSWTVDEYASEKGDGPINLETLSKIIKYKCSEGKVIFLH